MYEKYEIRKEERPISKFSISTSIHLEFEPFRFVGSLQFSLVFDIEKVIGLLDS